MGHGDVVVHDIMRSLPVTYLEEEKDWEEKCPRTMALAHPSKEEGRKRQLGQLAWAMCHHLWLALVRHNSPRPYTALLPWTGPGEEILQ